MITKVTTKRPLIIRFKQFKVGGIPVSEKGQPNGVATLGPDGKVPSAQLPSFTAPVTSVNSRTGDVVVTKTDVGLSLVPNVDARARSTHTGTQTASTISDFQSTVSANVDVSANTAARHTHSNKAILDATTASFTTADETKLDGIEAGATTDQVASEVPFTPNGDIVATNVQAAIQEVRDDTDTKLAGKASTAYVDAKNAANTRNIVQNAHGFTVGHVLRYNGTSYVLAQADSSTNAEVIGIVSAVLGANSFTLLTDGYITSLSGLTPGTTYFLSATTPGAITDVPPSTAGQVSKPLLRSDSATSGNFVNYRGINIITGTGAEQPSASALRVRPIINFDFTYVSASMGPFISIAVAGGSVTIPSIGGMPNHPGMARIRSSTTTNGGGYVGTNTTQLRIGGGEMFEAVVYPNTFTSTTTRLGFLDTASSVDATDGAYFEIDSTGMVVAKTASNGVRTTAGTTAALATGQWYRMVVEVNNTATSVLFTVYNESNTAIYSQSIATNIPTAVGRDTGLGVISTDSGVVAQDLIHIDYMALTYTKDISR